MTEPRSTAPLTPAMIDAIKNTEPGDLMKGGPTRAALIRRGLVHPMDTEGDRRYLRGCLTAEGKALRVKLLPAAPVQADPLEALQQQPAPGSVAGNSEAYYTKGCGADVLARTAELCATDAPDEDEDMHPECALKGCDIPEGLAECRVCGAELVEDPEERVTEDLADLGLSEATQADAEAVVVETVRRANVVSMPRRVTLCLLDGEVLVGATPEVFIAEGPEWGRLKGQRVRVGSSTGREVTDGLALNFYQAPEGEALGWRDPAVNDLLRGNLRVGDLLMVAGRLHRVQGGHQGYLPRLVPVRAY